MNLDSEIGNTEACCRAAIDAACQRGIKHVVRLPHDPQRWFDLLAGIPGDPVAGRALSRLTEQAAMTSACPAGAVARYGALQASLVALPRLTSLAVDNGLISQFCGSLQRIANRMDGSEKSFDPNGEPFKELALIVTLRRYHAGQSSFDIRSLPRTWFLRVHPLALPGMIREVAIGLGGLSPIVTPHLNYWRENPLLLLRKENDRAMCRIARTIMRQPEIRGMVAASWLYSIQVGKITPHLAWVRDFYLENGAYLIDMEPTPERLGFTIGSERRRRLYADGEFKPRNTLVLWRREDILTWAERYAESPDKPPLRVALTTRRAPSWRLDANKILSSGQLTLLNCEELMTFRPRIYWLLVFFLPLFLLSILVGAMTGIFFILPSLIIGVAITWLLQYFFLQ